MISAERLEQQKKYLEDYRAAVSGVENEWPEMPSWCGTEEWMEGLDQLRREGWLRDARVS